MGRARLAIVQLLGAAPFVLACFAARAEGPGASAAERWDDRHMRSNFAHFLDRNGSRPAIQGVDQDGRLVHDTATATRVKEQTLRINPLEWQPGGPRSTGRGDRSTSFSSAAVPPARTSSLRSASGSSDMRHAAP